MPNICQNQLRCLFPSKEKHVSFITSVVQSNWFSEFAPTNPRSNTIHPKLRQSIADLDLTCLLWNTKLEAFDVEITKNDYDRQVVELTFSTTWIPPIIIYRSMWETHGIEINAKYYESGEGLFGKCVYNSCEIIEAIYDYPIIAPTNLVAPTNLGLLQHRIGQDLCDYMKPEFEAYSTSVCP